MLCGNGTLRNGFWNVNQIDDIDNWVIVDGYNISALQEFEKS